LVDRITEYQYEIEGGETGKLSSIMDRDIITLSGVYKKAKAAGLVNNPEEFKSLVEKEVCSGLISGGGGTSSKLVKNRKLGVISAGVTGYLQKVESKPSSNLLLEVDDLSSFDIRGIAKDRQLSDYDAESRELLVQSEKGTKKPKTIKAEQVGVVRLSK